LYCYISSYIRNPFRARPKREVLRRLARDLRKYSNEGSKRYNYISMSNSSDPYTPPEEKMRITRDCLSLIREYDYPVLIITKSDLVKRDFDVISEMKASLSVTVTTLSENKSSILEPLAPSPKRRLEAIKEFSGVLKTSVRIDPIIPGINDSENEIRSLIEEISKSGADQVITSTYKPRPSDWKRLNSVFRIKADFSRKVGNSRYLPKEYRFNLISLVREISLEYGLEFSSCREGFPNLNTDICDGFDANLIGSRW